MQPQVCLCSGLPKQRLVVSNAGRQQALDSHIDAAVAALEDEAIQPLVQHRGLCIDLQL